jgi:hypothetical protein
VSVGGAQTTFQVECVPFGVEGESFGARGLGLELFCCQRMAHLRSSAENTQTFVSILGDDGILARSGTVVAVLFNQVYFVKMDFGMYKQPSVRRRDQLIAYCTFDGALFH